MVVTLKHHENHLISDHFFRVEPQSDWKGWLVAYLKSKTGRAIMSGQKYGHIIKHIEIPHFRALPVPRISAAWRGYLNGAVAEILRMRNEAHARTLEAERVFEEAVTPLPPPTKTELGFSVRASESLFSGRRRFDGLPHNPQVSTIREHFRGNAVRVESLKQAGYRLWLPNRFKRIPAADGVGLLESSSFFEINPDVQKKIVSMPGCGVEAGWLLIARSGQLYGLIGSVAIATKEHEGLMVSDDILRIAPTDQCTVRSGYVFVALTHPVFGRPLVKACSYGSSIPHIDPSDLAEVSLARLPQTTENRIADLAEEAAALRSQADILETRIAAEADTLIEAFIAGKDLEKIAAPDAEKLEVAAGGISGYNGVVTEAPMKGIEKTPGVNGGDACVAGTRISVWVLEEMRRQGVNEAELLADFLGLTPAKLADAWAYVKAHPAEIEAALNAHAEA